MPALARFGQNGPVEWATRAWAQTARPLGSNLRSRQRSSSETATKTRWPTCSARQRSPASPARASAASLRDAVRETGRFPSHAARIGAGLSPLPHLRHRADPPLLACLLTRLAMRDRNRDTRPVLRQQAVGGGGGRLCGRPPPRCLKLATVEDLRPGSGRALPGRKASASFVYAELLSPGAQPWPLLTRRRQHGEPCALHQLLTNAVTGRFWRSSFPHRGLCRSSARWRQSCDRSSGASASRAGLPRSFQPSPPGVDPGIRPNVLLIGLRLRETRRRGSPAEVRSARSR
jgi:hypothetical protein